MDLLILMVERRGQLITRAEIIEQLWGKDVFIEVDTAVNTVVRKIRQALRDSPDSPTFVETVQGKGYRFIGDVEVVTDVPAPTSDTPVTAIELPSVEPAPPIDRRPLPIAIGLAALLLVAALGVWAWRSSGTSTPTHVRLAVLPFETHIEPGREYLEDALHEETILALGQVDPEHLEVEPRRSMLPYKGTPKPLPQIAQELRVDYLVGSSIHAENGKIRVTARLIRARDQTDIWSSSYDNEPRSMLKFLSDLAGKIAEQVPLRLDPEVLAALDKRHTDNEAAFQLYFKGWAAWNQLDPPKSTLLALEFYKQATEIDPGYALPWAGLALAHAGAPINGDEDPGVAGDKARYAAERAITFNPNLAEAQTAMGAVNFWLDWDWKRAEDRFRKAVALDPGYPFGQRMLGILLSHQGRHAEAQKKMQELIRLEPKYEMNWALSAQVAFNAGEFAEAAVFAKQAKVDKPLFWIADYQLAMAQAARGEHEDALRTLDKHLSTPRPNSKLYALRGYILATMGRQDEAREVLKTLDTLSTSGRYVPPYARALIYTGLGDRNAALDMLERAKDEHDVHLILLPTDVKWKPFSSDRRFIELLDRCGFTR